MNGRGHQRRSGAHDQINRNVPGNGSNNNIDGEAGAGEEWINVNDDAFSFDDSERFEEDSVCSWISETESITTNWTGWDRSRSLCGGTAIGNGPQHGYGGGGGSGGLSYAAASSSYSTVLSLVELCAKSVAVNIPFEYVEHFVPPVPEELQIRIAFWSFPEMEDDIRLYSCLASGSAEEYQKGEQLFRAGAVKETLQIGFHLSAKVEISAGNASSARVNSVSFNRIGSQSTEQMPNFGVLLPMSRNHVAVTLDRKRIISCSCSCGASNKWCAHVVAVCLHRINKPKEVNMRAPVSESLSRLGRDQLQKFAQYLINELPQTILPTAQKLLDELLDQKGQTLINQQPGAPDPTAGASVVDEANWCLEEGSLRDKIRRILGKFCVPSPTVLSDVNYLSSTAPPAATEWQSILQALVGRLPEGLWNLLSIIREMYARRDANAVRLLHILTQECLASNQVLLWWYGTKFAQTVQGSQYFSTSKAGFGNSVTAQYSCAFLCDEIVALWRLALLNPGLSPRLRATYALQLREYHLKAVDRIEQILSEPSDGQNLRQIFARVPDEQRKLDFEAFPGFRPAVENSVDFWKDFPIPGITYKGYRQSMSSAISPLECLNNPSLMLDCSTPSPKALSPLSRCTTGSPSVPVIRERKGTFSGYPIVAASSTGPSAARATGNGSSCAAAPAATLLNSSSFTEDSAVNSSSNTSSNSSTNGDAAATGLLNPQQETAEVPSAKAASSVSVALPPTTGNSEAQKDDIDRLYFYDAATAQELAEKGLGRAKYRRSTRDVLEEAFATLKQIDDPFEIKFARAEALHTHGFLRHACKLAVELAQELMRDPPNLMVDIPAPALVVIANGTGTGSTPGNNGVPSTLTPSKQGRKKKRSMESPVYVHPLAYQISAQASETLKKVHFLCSVLSGYPNYYALAFQIGLFGLEMPRQPAATKFLEVQLHRQEALLVELLKQLPLGSAQMSLLREHAARFTSDYYSVRYPQPVLPLSLANFVFEALCDARGFVGSSMYETDENCGFEAAVNALGLRSCVTEAEHPLLCEGMRRQKGELALNLLLKYKDQLDRLALIMDRLLDPEVHKMYKDSATNAAYYLPYANNPQSASCGRAKSASKVSRMLDELLEHNSSNIPTIDFSKITLNPEHISRLSLPSNSTCQRILESPYEQSKTGVPVKFQFERFDSMEGSGGQPPTIPDSEFSDSSGISQGLNCRSRRASGDSEQPGSSHEQSACSSRSSPKVPQPVQSESRSASRYTNTTNGGNTKASEAQAHFMFELAKNLLTKAGGNHSTSIFSHASSSQHTSGGGPHRALHLCAFQIGLYALGLHNCTSPNWLSRTYSSHVSWISGQAMEIGRVALKILMSTWDRHLTPTEVANLADKASQSQSRDSGMVLAAAELALSALPHAHALNPAETQRALDQCREQSNSMLEQACSAVEQAARSDGVYPEVLWLVAREWERLYKEVLENEDHGQEQLSRQSSVSSQDHHRPTNSGVSVKTNQQHNSTPMRHHIIPSPPVRPPATVTMQMVPQFTTHPSFPTHPHHHPVLHQHSQVPQQQPPSLPQAQQTPHLTLAMPPPMPPQMATMTPPGPSTPQHPATVPITVAATGSPFRPYFSTQMPPQQAPTAVLMNRQQQQQQQVNAAVMAAQQAAAAAVAATSNAAAFQQFPQQVMVTANHAGVPMHQPHHHHGGVIHWSPGIIGPTPVSRAGAATPVFLNANGSAGTAPTGAIFHHFGPSLNHPPPRLHLSRSAPALAPQLPATHHPGAVPHHASHGGAHPATTPDLMEHPDGRKRCLFSAYRVGMLAMETMGRRILDDNRNYVKYAKSPPYGDDVVWLFQISKQLGLMYVQHFCLTAAQSVPSPFILHDLAKEASSVLSRGTTPLGKALMHPYIQPLMNKCLQMFYHASHQKLSHPRFTPSDMEELVALVKEARAAFLQTPDGSNQFNVFLHSLRKQKACKKELWTRLMDAVNPPSHS